MADDTIIHVPQEHETPATTFEWAGYQCRYAYARSADSRVAGDPGQDRLVLRSNEQQLALVLCDGVSQSFVGDLAARLLADALLDWLTTISEDGTATVVASLTERLTTLVAEVQPVIDGFVLPNQLSAMLRDVLEQKRVLGSESTFVAVQINIPKDRLVLAWMGDSRMRLWGRQEERTHEFGNSFHTAERWSSRHGLVGTPHVAVLPLSDVTRLLIYSDGLTQLDQQAGMLSNEALNTLITAADNTPTSDDVSLIEVWRTPSEQRSDDKLVAPAHPSSRAAPAEQSTLIKAKDTAAQPLGALRALLDRWLLFIIGACLVIIGILLLRR